MSNPQIKQAVPIAVLGSGEEVHFTSEWIRILQQISSGSTAASSSSNTAGVLTDILSRLTTAESDIVALKAAVQKVAAEGYQS